MRDPYELPDDYDPDDIRDPGACLHCEGRGRVATMDWESYFGANYKPCPECGLDVCSDQPPISS